MVFTFYGIMKRVILLGSTRDHEIENLYASKPIFFIIRTSSCNVKSQRIYKFLEKYEMRISYIVIILIFG